jgi:hypothetical protein
MKKVSILLVALFAIIGELKAQTLSVNLFGGYTFNDELHFNTAYAKVNGGGIWGASLEGISARGTALELLYQYQSTTVPVYTYAGPNGPLNSGKDGAVISYLLLNGIQYFHTGEEEILPYFGVGLGAAFISADQGNSATKFAADLKGGVKIKAGHALAFKLGAQLLNSVQQSGYYYYYGYPYATYTSLWQFSFTGGVTFDFGH